VTLHLTSWTCCCRSLSETLDTLALRRISERLLKRLLLSTRFTSLHPDARTQTTQDMHLSCMRAASLQQKRLNRWAIARCLVLPTANWCAAAILFSAVMLYFVHMYGGAKFLSASCFLTPFPVLRFWEWDHLCSATNWSQFSQFSTCALDMVGWYVHQASAPAHATTLACSYHIPSPLCCPSPHAAARMFTGPKACIHALHDASCILRQYYMLWWQLLAAFSFSAASRYRIIKHLSWLQAICHAQASDSKP
jgi:hypothetical protein